MSGCVPAGWVLVPVEPTQEMVDAAVEYWHTRAQALDDLTRGQYAAMIAATPTPPSRDADVEREARELLAQAYERANLTCPAADVRAKNKIDWVREAVALDALRAALQALGERG